ncbi:MAG: hypothetical protein FWD53_08020 [Phycisphaerales bacterium]|nr:hypothetical protein [Phycisphaerales bacterium]
MLLFGIGGFLVVAVTLWLMAEVQRWSTAARIGTGVLAMVAICFCVCVLFFIKTTFEYNAWYSHATKKLIGTSIKAIEGGRTEQVLKAWRELDQEFHWTYDGRGRFDELVDEVVKRIEESAPATTEPAR